MMPEKELTDTTGQERGQKVYWSKPTRCSICTGFILFHPIALKEPVEAPEPRHEWLLCKPCHEALLVELNRSSILSSLRLRIAIGLVAAERSPNAYFKSPSMHEQQDFQREFVWAMRLMIFFALFHIVIFAILFAVPK